MTNPEPPPSGWAFVILILALLAAYIAATVDGFWAATIIALLIFLASFAGEEFAKSKGRD